MTDVGKDVVRFLRERAKHTDEPNDSLWRHYWPHTQRLLALQFTDEEMSLITPAAEARFEKGFLEYGDSSFTKSSRELYAESAEEQIDSAQWACIHHWMYGTDEAAVLIAHGFAQYLRIHRLMEGTW